MITWSAWIEKKDYEGWTQRTWVYGQGGPDYDYTS
jgi:hypothetical protein